MTERHARGVLFGCLAAAAMTFSTAIASQAQPHAGMARASIAMVAVADGEIIKVGWKSKRKRAGMRHRTSRRPHGNSRRGFRGDGSRAAILPTIPGIASTLIQRRKCLDALFPGSDPACN